MSKQKTFWQRIVDLFAKRYDSTPCHERMLKSREHKDLKQRMAQKRPPVPERVSIDGDVFEDALDITTAAVLLSASDSYRDDSPSRCNGSDSSSYSSDSSSSYSSSDSGSSSSYD